MNVEVRWGRYLTTGLGKMETVDDLYVSCFRKVVAMKIQTKGWRE